jgi:hypothetical protein
VVRSPTEARCRPISLPQGVQTGSGAHPAISPGVPKTLLLGIKRPGLKADHLATSSAEIKNEWSHTSALAQFSMFSKIKDM